MSNTITICILPFWCFILSTDPMFCSMTYFIPQITIAKWPSNYFIHNSHSAQFSAKKRLGIVILPVEYLSCYCTVVSILPEVPVATSSRTLIIGASGLKREAITRELPLPIAHHATTSDVLPIWPIGIANLWFTVHENATKSTTTIQIRSIKIITISFNRKCTSLES